VSPTPYRDYRLPSGRHDLSPEEVAANRRWRLIGAASEVLAEKRLRGVTARQISRRAAVSNYTFYEHFSGVDDVLAAAFKLAAELLVEVMGSACAVGVDGSSGRRNAVASVLAFAAREPGLASLMRLEVAVGVPTVAAERELLVDRLESLLGADQRIDANEAWPRAWRSAVGAAMALGLDRLEDEESTAADAADELAAILP
jgi:DNA-binding transcriptional regulator YbjK